jgi:hypothetical protein
MLKWAFNEGCTLPTDADEEAVTIGNVDLLEWLVEKERCRLRAELFERAAGAYHSNFFFEYRHYRIGNADQKYGICSLFSKEIQWIKSSREKCKY